jgi:hypothetical protein
MARMLRNLAVVRYFTAIARTRERGGPTSAKPVSFQHKPFQPLFEALNGRDEPYTLCELAAFVQLPAFAQRRAGDIRTDGHNIETFDRLRRWAYAVIGEYRRASRDV